LKKDILFILFVVFAGIAGLIYTNDRSKNALIKKAPLASENEGSISSPEPPSRASDFVPRRTRSVNTDIGVSLPSSYSVSDSYTLPESNYLKEIDQALSDKKPLSEGSIDEAKGTPWQSKFDYWKLSLIDVVTSKTELDDVTSALDCFVVFTKKKKKPVLIDFGSSLQFEVGVDSFSIYQNEDSQLTLSDLKDGIALRVSSRALTDHCAEH